MSGVAHLLKSLGDFQPVLSAVPLDNSADSSVVVEDLVQTVVTEVEAPPAKKARVSSEGNKWKALGAKSLVPHYESMEDVPDRLRKCELLSPFFLLALVE